ncbi:MAG: heat-inducible transcriptional repressor HrcA [Eubacteriales bacterium]|nr:heat-inducible transcriptional repressor HrcA [Eubacteriales bacterium]MDD3199619.1 heat-inducible transcriptional repressor HrcA [Eubacteriales bacterium]MDD4629886.1 heat-inducible transcriptional repressor HrcA [Eubacteriales bacterium]
MDLSERKLKILQAIVADFISSAEPIGSRTLSKKYDMGISPATIRNEMSDLEDMGYLTHPHTSAGRVPSDKAYRLYVNNLMQKYEIPEEDKQIISEKLTTNVMELERTIKHAASLLSDLTNLASFAITPNQESNKLKHINFLPVDKYSVVLMIVTESGRVINTTIKLKTAYTEENLNLLSRVMTYNYKGKTLSDILTLDIIKTFESDIEAMSRLVETIKPNFISTLENMLDVELYMDGLANIFSIPEYNDIEKAKVFLDIINQRKQFTDVLINRENGVIITIGNENKEDLMRDCSLITATYHVNGKLVGKLGVIGPTRMRYDEVTSIIEYMTDNISETFKVTGGDKDYE